MIPAKRAASMITESFKVKGLVAVRKESFKTSKSLLLNCVSTSATPNHSFRVIPAFPVLNKKQLAQILPFLHCFDWECFVKNSFSLKLSFRFVFALKYMKIGK